MSEQLTVGSLFSGIGGLDLGLERAGMRVLWQCESDPYCRAVLRKHWPDVPCHPDVRQFGHSNFITGVDVLAGGFPCQPVSLAGSRTVEDKHPSGAFKAFRLVRCGYCKACALATIITTHK
jgi:DNA (cytosine-5)-methyltransferase 1